MFSSRSARVVGAPRSVARHVSAIAASAVILGFLGTAHAQTFLGSIVGLVTDTSRLVVPGATVTLVEVQTGVERTTATNAEGNYVFADIRPGVYIVTVSSAGLKQVVSSEITITTQHTARFDAQLEAGDVKESVEVAALAPTMNTENAQLGDIRTRDELLTLPINDRSTRALRNVTSSNYGADGASYLGGQRARFGFYSIDGVTAMAPAWGGNSGPTMDMSLEALQEVTIVTSNTSAEFGDIGTIYLGTRSGTNVPHGSLFYQHSNNAFNARNAFGSAEKPKGPLLHEMGGSFGGPVYIPGLYSGHNRTFFFFAYERTEPPATQSISTSVPTVKMRQGDFSELAEPIIDPTTGAAFPGNAIPQNRLSPVALRMQDEAFMPLPNFGPEDAYSNNYRYVRQLNQASNRYSIRGDHTFSATDSLSARLTTRRDDQDAYDSTLPAFSRFQHRNTYNAYVSESHIFSPSVVNELRVGFTRDVSPIRGVHNGAEVAEEWGIEGLTLENKRDLSGVPRVSWTSFPGSSGNPLYREFNTYRWDHQTYELLNNVTFSKGTHLLKTGFLMRHYRSDEFSSDSFADFGTYSFNGFATGFDYADFLLGVPHETQRLEQAPERAQRYGYLAGYIQDDWRLTPKLTLNFGLRYEYGLPPTDENDLRYAFDPSTGNLVVPTQQVLDNFVHPLFPRCDGSGAATTCVPVVIAAEAGFPSRSLMSGDASNWGPRVGFAYRPLEGTVVRGGYGIYYTPLTHSVLNPFVGGPFESTETFRNEIVDGVPVFAFPHPFIEDADVPTQSAGGITRSPRVPYSHQWNLTVEKQLPHAMVARVSWRGHRVLQLFYNRDLNKPLPSPDPANAERRDQYPHLESVDFLENGGTQLGNLLEVEVERRFSQGLTFQAGWTWARVSSDVPGNDVSSSIENPYDRAREWADDPAIPRHRAVFSAIYELPFGTGKPLGEDLPGWVQQSFGNWQISSILVMRTGRFVTPTFASGAGDFSNTRMFGGRPDQRGEWRVSDPSAEQWFDPSAFAEPSPGTFGNAGRSIIEGPGLANLDLGLFKFFRIGQSARLRLDVTATNVLNHVNLGNPVANLSNANAGRIVSYADDGLGAGPREIRLGLRIDF